VSEERDHRPATAMGLWPTYRGLGIYRMEGRILHTDSHSEKRVTEWSHERLRKCRGQRAFYAVPNADSFSSAIRRMETFERMAKRQRKRT